MKLSKLRDHVKGTLNSRDLELLVTRLLGVLVSLFTIPFVIENCGTRVYGIFILISSISIFMTIFDFGIGNAIINPIVNALETNRKYLSVILTNIACLISAISLVILILMTLANRSSERIWQFALGQNFDLNRNYLLIAVIGTSFSFIGNITQKFYLALSLNIRSSRIQFATLLCSNLGILIASNMKNPLPSMLFASLILPNLIWITALIKILFQLDFIRIKFEYISKNEMFLLFKNGQVYFFLQAASILNYQIDVILISRYFSADQISEYSIVMKVASIPLILITTVVQPVWSQTAAFYSKGLKREAILNLMVYMKKIAFVSISAMIFFIGFGKVLISSWTSGQIVPSSQLILSNAIWIPLSCVMQLYAMFLNGAGKRRFILLTTSLFTVSNLSLAIFFLETIGNLAGPMWSNSISFLFFFFVPAIYFTMSISSERPNGQSRK